MMKSILIACLSVVCALTTTAQEVNFIASNSASQSSLSGKAMAAATNVKNDVNNDGLVDALDVVHIVKHVQGQTLSVFKVDKADINNDNVVDFEDATALSKLISGIETPAADEPVVTPPDEPVTPPASGAIRGDSAKDPTPPTL